MWLAYKTSPLQISAGVWRKNKQSTSQLYQGGEGNLGSWPPGNGIQYSNSTRHRPGSHPHCLMVKIKAFHLPHRPAGRCYERKDFLVNSDIPTYVKQEAPRRCFEKMHQEYSQGTKTWRVSAPPSAAVTEDTEKWGYQAREHLQAFPWNRISFHSQG